MFEVLVESGMRGRAGLGPRVTSLIVHGGLIALAAVGVRRGIPEGIVEHPPVVIDEFFPSVSTPVAQTGGGPALPGSVLGAPPSIPLDAPAFLPPIGAPIVSPVVGPSPQELAGRDLLGTGHDDLPATAAPVLLAGEVDEPVSVRVPARLVYPPHLAAAGVGGEVRLEFVVDTAGRCEPASVRILDSTDRGFESSARDAVCGATYRPGRVRGQAVRQLVQQKVAFRQR